jgi:3-phenylpropionate/trans-cinnamate dioxygenase ferredoxin reductase subunit
VPSARESEGIVIVGGGLGAARTVVALRDLKYPGRITLLSDETRLPYDRPPLSKGYLQGKVAEDKIRLLTAEQLAQLQIEWRGGVAASGLDRERRRVRLADGSSIGYEQLVVATGARPNRLSQFEHFDNVHVLRSLADADALRAALAPGRRLCIVGAGFIGLEIASTAIELGCRVTLVEAAPTPLAAILGPQLGARIQRWHEGKGAAFHCGARIAKVIGTGTAEGLELSDGTSVLADAIVVGIGQCVNTEWLSGSGLELDRGLVCDPYGRSSDPLVFGVGDAACVRVGAQLCPTRHWTATTEQARRVAAAICGPGEAQGVEGADAIVEDNYFWSDQYGLRLQFAGHVSGEPRLVWVSGSQDAERFAVLCCTAGEVTAVFSLGCVRDFLTHSMPLRRGERVGAPIS